MNLCQQDNVSAFYFFLISKHLYFTFFFKLSTSILEVNWSKEKLWTYVTNNHWIFLYSVIYIHIYIHTTHIYIKDSTYTWLTTYMVYGTWGIPTSTNKMSLLFNMLSRLIIAFLPRSKDLDFMTAVTSFSDFGAPQNSLSLFPHLLSLSDGTGCHDLNFMNVEFEANFFTLLFHFHQEAL